MLERAGGRSVRWAAALANNVSHGAGGLRRGRVQAPVHGVQRLFGCAAQVKRKRPALAGLFRGAGAPYFFGSVVIVPLGLELAAPAAGAGVVAGAADDMEPLDAGAVLDDADELAASGALVASDDVAGAGAGADGAGVELVLLDDEAGGVAVVVVEDFSLQAERASASAAAKSRVLFMRWIPVEWW